MTGYALSTAAATVPLVLVAAGALHAADRRAFAAALRRQRLWPHGVEATVAWAVIVAEVAIGAAALAGVIAAVTGGSTALAAAALAAAACLLGAYAAYTTILLRVRPGAPCACAAVDAPVSPGVPARALALALVAGALARGQSELATLGLAYWEVALTVLSAASFAVLLLALPSALAGLRIARPRSGGLS